MIIIPRGIIKQGILYYLGAAAAFLAIANIPVNIRLVLTVVLLIISGYGAYLNYFVDKIARAIILGGIALIFIPCLLSGYSGQPAWRPYYFFVGIVFSIFLINIIVKTVKRSGKIT